MSLRHVSPFTHEFYVHENSVECLWRNVVVSYEGRDKMKEFNTGDVVMIQHLFSFENLTFNVVFVIGYIRQFYGVKKYEVDVEYKEV